MQRLQKASNRLGQVIADKKNRPHMKFILFWGVPFLAVMLIANWYISYIFHLSHQENESLLGYLENVIPKEALSNELSRITIKKQTEEIIVEINNLIASLGRPLQDKDYEKIKELIRSKRFSGKGMLEEGYFFMYDREGRVQAHGADQSLEEKVLWNRRDMNGLYVIQALDQAACRDPEEKVCKGDFVDYTWPLPSNPKGPELRKTAYVKLIKELNWWIGTGFYDVFETVKAHDRKNQERSLQALWITAGFSIISGALFAVVAYWHAVRLATELTAQERFAAQLWHSSEDGLVVTDAEGLIIAANSHAQDMFLYPAQELIGKPLNVLLPVELQEEYAVKMYQVIRQGLTFRHTDLRRLRKDGVEVHIDVVMAPVTGLDGTIQYRIHAIRDVTQERARVAEIEQMNRDLEKALETEERLQLALMRKREQAAIGRIVAGVVHEFRQPVESIRLIVDSCRQSPHDLSSLMYGLELIHKMVEELGEKLASIQRSTHPRNDSESSFRIDEAVAKAVALREPKLRKNEVTVDLKLASGGIIHGDMERLRLVLCTIIDNAVEAMERSERKALTVETRNRNQIVEVRISDTGSGIATDDLENIFEPGFSTKGGDFVRGLGLHYSREIVQEDFGGSLRAEHREGGGTVLIMTLPLAENLGDESGPA